MVSRDATIFKKRVLRGVPIDALYLWFPSIIILIKVSVKVGLFAVVFDLPPFPPKKRP